MIRGLHLWLCGAYLTAWGLGGGGGHSDTDTPSQCGHAYLQLHCIDEFPTLVTLVTSGILWERGRGTCGEGVAHSGDAA